MIALRLAISTVVLAGMIVHLRASAQTPPPVRALGPVIHVTTQPLGSVAEAVSLQDGRVYVNDITDRRVLLFDPTLSNATVVADTTDATASAYGDQAGTLIHFRGDTALYIDRGSLSMLVLGPAGKIVRVMALPRPDDARFAIGSIFGTPGVDARGQLVYYSGMAPAFMVSMLFGKMANLKPLFDMPNMLYPPGKLVDSGYVVGVDLVTRKTDTLTAVAIPKVTSNYPVNSDGFLVSIDVKRDPLPLVDDWTVLPDGSIAVVRGRDFHVDWFGTDGRWTSTPKIPFDWQRVSDDQKRALIDSAVTADQANLDGSAAQRAAASRAAASTPAGAASTSAASGGRGGRGGGGGGGGSHAVPNIVVRPELNDLPDYFPPFQRGATFADASGNLWIRTTTIVNGQPVYDIVNREKGLVDRVQLPPFRTIAGFGPGVVYMAVKDSSGAVHLEEAKEE